LKFLTFTGTELIEVQLFKDIRGRIVESFPKTMPALFNLQLSILNYLIAFKSHLWSLSLLIEDSAEVSFREGERELNRFEVFLT